MTIDQAQAFLQAIRAKNIRVKNDVIVQASCPLAKWTHSSHKDASPSFALFCTPGSATSYHCFACGSGSAEDLLGMLTLYAKEGITLYDMKSARLILENEEYVTPLPDYQEGAAAVQVFEAWPDWWLDSFQPVAYNAKAMAYLAGRGITPELAMEFELRFDSKREMIVCPYWNVHGKFSGARGRSIHGNVSGAKKHYDYSYNGRNNAKLTLYNEQVLQSIAGPVVIVEGQFDVINVHKVWKKVVGNMTALAVEEKVKKLCESDIWIHIPDPDDAGDKSIAGYQEAAKKYGCLYKLIDLPKGDEKIDPAQCHPEYLKDRITQVLS